MRTGLCALSLILIAAGAGRAQPTDGKRLDPKAVEFFETKIRPVLVDQCYQCHSVEAAKNKKLRGGLFLDTKAGVLKGGESGPAVVPGKSKSGHLMDALRYEGDVKMPPKKKLPAEVIADFAKWIEIGAPDPREGEVSTKAAKTIDLAKGREFWSFRPIVGHPRAKDSSGWAKTPIDSYIVDKIKEQKADFRPNAPASREKLIRRAYFDLWGLPPTPAQIEAFVNDPDPDAYTKLVDHLLAGPAYGERWGRHWLDVVRFAESGGYEFDGDRPGAFHYRDWVIKALNADMPYNEFIRMQIAGDILQPGDFDAATATGYLVAGPYPGQTTSKTLALIRYNHLDDMASTIGSSVLGLTLGCARCHDHKYDPIPQADYYRLIANLARTDSNKASLDMQPDVYRKAKAEFDAAHAPLVAAKEKLEAEKLPKSVAAWHATAAKLPVAEWQTLEPVEFKGKGPMERLPDGSVRPKGKVEKSDTITIVAQTYLRGITGLRLEALADADFPKKGPGLDADGSFSVAEISVQATPLAGKGKAAPVKLRAVASTSQGKDAPLTAAIDGNPKTEWRIDPADAGKDHAAQFEIVGALGDPAGVQLTITLKFGGKASSIGRPRLAITTHPTPPDIAAAANLQNTHELVAILKPSEGKITPANLANVRHWYRTFDDEYAAVLKKVEEHAKTAPEQKKRMTPVFVAAGNKGGDVHFLIRGEVERKGTKAEPGYLQVLPNPSEKAKVDPRVALADWLVDPQNGAGVLAARVMANRLWQHHFGRGLVATPNDFGAQGEPPTHPELLDYLAGKLVHNWKLKPLHREIMLSAVYMQSGDLNDTALKADPNDRLWWRRPPQRLEAEIVRDALLTVGGSLNPAMYGQGTLDVNSPRRSIYLTVKRSQPVPMLQMMDAPEAIQSVGERSLTTVPTQSLAFMNSPLVRKQAENLAKLLLKLDNEAAIERAYQTTLGRRPTSSERQRMTTFIESQAKSYGTNEREQALADFCQALLCSNEFVYVD